MGLREDVTQTINEASGWNPFGFLADNALIMLFILGLFLILLLRLISTPKRLLR